MAANSQPAEVATSKVRQAFLALRSEILDGYIPPGTRLSLRPTAKRLGVGMNAVSEALRELEHEGLVEVEPRVGAKVCQRDSAAVRSDFILRIAVECEAARRCAARQVPANLSKLEQLATHVDELAAGDDLEATHQADIDFHLAVARFADAPSLERTLRPLLPRLVILDQLDATSPDHAPAGHLHIVDAIRTSEDKASNAIRTHIEDAMYWGLGAGFGADSSRSQ